jgi:nitrogen PTS system EIIA component
MHLTDVLDVDRIAVDITVSSKKSLLEKAAALLAATPDSADSRDIFESLCQRERLGSTGLGHGVAIPHGRVTGQQTVAAAVIRLQRAIDFDAPDSDPVDLFFALAVPDKCTDVHLRLLADIAERLGREQQRKAIREATDSDQLLKLLSTDLAESSRQ